MPVLNCVIAHNLDKLADPIERGGGNPFRMRAYRSAARIVGDLPPSVTGMTAPGEDLAERPGIREDLAERSRRSLRPAMSACSTRRDERRCYGAHPLYNLERVFRWAQTPGDPFLWSRK
jgi:Helix-hairpin-helix domain